MRAGGPLTPMLFKGDMYLPCGRGDACDSSGRQALRGCGEDVNLVLSEWENIRAFSVKRDAM